MKIQISQALELGLQVLTSNGYTDDEAKKILDVLLYAQMRGNNQGLVKLIGNGYPKHPDAQSPSIVRDRKVSALVNGNLSPAIVVLQGATELVLSKVKKYGIGIVGTNNTNLSTGALGHYANYIADQGFIAFIFAGSPERVAPHGSYEPIFGTNPIAIGIPSRDGPVILDMSTSSMTFFGLIEAKTAGKKIPENMAYDSKGNVTTDPVEALSGALMAFGGSHKSSGLSMIVEILTGPLVHASFAGVGDTKHNLGNLILAMDPELLRDKKDFENEVAILIKQVKNTKKLPGVDTVYIPGEKGNITAERNSQAGTLDIEKNIYDQLCLIAKRMPNEENTARSN